MLRKIFTLFIFIGLMPGFGTTVAAQETYDVHIRGGLVIDGTGEKAYEADILIKADSITFIGKLDEKTVNTVKIIDATGKIISPGFIDMHAHGNPLSTPEFQNFLAMGVTAIVLGQDGSSPTGESLKEWFERVEEVQTAVNIAALAGHGTIRRNSGLEKNTVVNERDLEALEKQLKDNLDDGAFGLSLGLEYVPGLYAEAQELERLAKAVGAYDGIVMSHIRSEDDSRISASLEELAGLGKYSKVHVSHLKVVYGKGADRAEEILHKLKNYQDNGIDITADTYPYAASFTGIGIVFPNWAKTEEEWKHAMDENPEILREYLTSKVAQRNGPEAILFGTGKYAGKTLKEAAASEGVSAIDLLLKIGPRAASAAHFVMNVELQDRITVVEEIMISSDGSPTMRHPRGYGSFAKVINKYVVEQDRLPIEKAIYKMSGLPAKTLGISDRGTLAVGNKADILIFNPNEVQDLATFESPHELAKGFHWVIVNGKVAKENDVFSEERNGRVLRKYSELTK